MIGVGHWVGARHGQAGRLVGASPHRAGVSPLDRLTTLEGLGALGQDADVPLDFGTDEQSFDFGIDESTSADALIEGLGPTGVDLTSVPAPEQSTDWAALVGKIATTAAPLVAAVVPAATALYIQSQVKKGVSPDQARASAQSAQQRAQQVRAGAAPMPAGGGIGGSTLLLAAAAVAALFLMGGRR